MYIFSFFFVPLILASVALVSCSNNLCSRLVFGLLLPVLLGGQHVYILWFY